MSTLLVEVCEIKDVEKHPNADLLDIVTVKGWKVIVKKDSFTIGDKCVYFPPDSVMQLELSDRLGITKYLSPLPKNLDGTRPEGNRVRAARLRGEASFGTVMKCEHNDWEIGKDVKEYYNITKFEPPPKACSGDAETQNELFHKYTDIENIRNFPDVLKHGEEVIITEKIHGSNLRMGIIRENDEWVFAAGSNSIRRKEFTQNGNISDYWRFMNDNIKNMLKEISQNKFNVIIFGEMYGPGVQDMAYGCKNLSFRAFDISIDMKYLDYQDKCNMLNKYGIEMVPVLYKGPFSWDIVEQYTCGQTTLCEPEKAGKFKGREGIVITPVVERAEFKGNYSRVIFKSISVDYLSRKDGTEYH